MDIPKDWFTQASLLTFVGATGIVFVVNNAFRLLFHIEWIAIPFLLSVAVVVLGASSVGTLKKPVDYVIALANASLLFLTAVGGQEALAAGGGGGGGE